MINLTITEETRSELQTYGQHQLSGVLMHAAEVGALDVVQYVLTSPELTVHANIHHLDDACFKKACFYGHVSIVDYFLHEKNIDTPSEDVIHRGFEIACEMGRLDVVQYLSKHAFVDIHRHDDHAFHLACDSGQLNVLEYLITSSDLSNQVNVHTDYDYIFSSACENGYLNIVQFCLESPLLAEHININEYEGYQTACHHKRYNIIQYLLSCPGGQYLEFEKTSCNLLWAMGRGYNNIVYQMMIALYKYDGMAYIDKIGMVEKWCNQSGFNNTYQAIISHQQEQQEKITSQEINLVF